MSSSIWNKPSSASSAVTYVGGKHPPMRGCDGLWRKEDFLSREGAAKLGEIARKAWAAQGYDVPFVVVPVTSPNHGEPMFAPRFPTLLNGMPVA